MKPLNVQQPVPPEIMREPWRLELLNSHPTWQQHSLTKELVKILESKKALILEHIQNLSLNPDSNLEAMRIQGVRLSEVNNTLKYIYDSTQIPKLAPARA